MTKMMAIGPKSNHGSESIPSVLIDEEANRNGNSASSPSRGHCKSSSCGHKNQNGPNVGCELTGTGPGTDISSSIQDKCEEDSKKNHNCSRKPETTTTYSFDALSKFDGANNVTLPLSSRRSHERTASQRSSWESFDDRFKVSLSSITGLLNGHTTLTIVFFILALLQGATLGFWINLYHTINTTMPHTFSWLSLLNPMGSTFTVEECASTSSNNQMELLESNSKSKCDVTHSSPLIPLVGICLSSFGLFNTTLFLACSSCRKAVLLYLKQTVFLQFLVLLFSGISCGVLLSNNLNGLRELMTQEMGIFKHPSYSGGEGEGATTNESFRWRLTQSSNECCGLNGFSDWLSPPDFQNKLEDSASALKAIPTSCFSVSKNEGSEQPFLFLLVRDTKVKAEDESGRIPVPVVGPKDQINVNKIAPAEQGCYDLEYNIILFYAKYQVGLLILGFITSIGLYRVAKRLSSQTERCNGGSGGILKKEKFENPQSHRIFIRQGSNITAFGGQGRSSHVIRKNGILMEATGALASSTGVNENVISLEILDYSESLDKVQVTRESDRIVIMVTKHGILRGKAMLTAKDDLDLERVLVTPTSFGINISV